MNDAVGRVAGTVAGTAALGDGTVVGATGEVTGLSQPTITITQIRQQSGRIRTTERLQVYHSSMASAVASVPDANALLCESCGYTLTGLDRGGDCPECGKGIVESAPELRKPAAWEVDSGFIGFLRTTAAVLFWPT